MYAGKGPKNIDKSLAARSSQLEAQKKRKAQKFRIFTQITGMATPQLKELFEQAASESQSLSERPSNDSLLQLYSLYKQATIGDIDTQPPANPFDFVAKAKYEAWMALKGKSSEAAMQEYTDLVNKLKT
jgi:diazepam-binding inhibitor (GABA receptor modulating acyl-CoA-binding protein)